MFAAYRIHTKVEIERCQCVIVLRGIEVIGRGGASCSRAKNCTFSFLVPLHLAFPRQLDTTNAPEPSALLSVTLLNIAIIICLLSEPLQVTLAQTFTSTMHSV
jgi:hypothetical protein